MTSENGSGGTAPTAEELLAAVVDAVARRVIELQAGPRQPAAEPWIDADQAAEHMACKRQRIYDLVNQRSTNGFPVSKDGSRLLFKRSALDRWLERGR